MYLPAVQLTALLFQLFFRGFISKLAEGLPAQVISNKSLTSEVGGKLRMKQLIRFCGRNFSFKSAIIYLLLLTFSLNLWAQSPAFTYQGKLTDNGIPANGTYDLQFTLRDAATAGNSIGSTIDISAQTVTNGVFTVTLDFGAGAFTGQNRWLEISVRNHGDNSAHVTLSPRQPITAVPYAAYAMTPAGPQGPIGPKGDTGAQGVQGIQGATGLTGPQGPKGDQGLTGLTGPQGEMGPQGLQGIQGIQGLRGLSFKGSWLAASAYAVDDAVFFDGSAWLAKRANTNVSPNEGADWTLLAQKGDTGTQGVQGIQGATGLTGPQGPKGDQGLTGLTGPQGEMGPQGLQGIQGIQGLRGLSFKGSWLAASAYAVDDAVFFNGSAWLAKRANTNVSPNEGADWTLLAQKGDIGTQGVQGIQGATGLTGPQGPKGDQGLTGLTGPQGPPGTTTADGLTSGTLADARLSANVALLNSSPTFSGTVTANSFIGSGVGLSGVPGALPWQVISGSSYQLAENSSIMLTSESAVNLTLPANPTIGSVIRIASGASGVWQIKQNAGQSVFEANSPIESDRAWTATETSRNWIDVASSFDGSKAAALVAGGQIYVSTDSGATWTARESSRQWRRIACSYDGGTMAAVGQSTRIYVSANGGTNWTARDSSRTWSSITCSADGTKIAASDSAGFIYISTDSGANWSQRYISNDWQRIAISGDGNKLIAVETNGNLHYSHDGGAAWTELAVPFAGTPTQYIWSDVAGSHNGNVWIAAGKLSSGSSGLVYVSTDSGLTWTWLENGPSDLSRVGISADGVTMVGSAYNSSSIAISRSRGNTWTGGSPNNNWPSSVNCSPNGLQLYATYSSDKLYLMGKSYDRTTAGNAGALLGSKSSYVELLYTGNGQFMITKKIGPLFKL